MGSSVARVGETALKYAVPCVTTLSGTMAAVHGIAAVKEGRLGVRSLQSLA